VAGWWRKGRNIKLLFSRPEEKDSFNYRPISRFNLFSTGPFFLVFFFSFVLFLVAILVVTTYPTSPPHFLTCKFTLSRVCAYIICVCTLGIKLKVCVYTGLTKKKNWTWPKSARETYSVWHRTFFYPYAYNIYIYIYIHERTCSSPNELCRHIHRDYYQLTVWESFLAV